MLVSSAAGFRFIGNNRIISFVLIKYKKIFSHEATKTKIRQKSVHRACRGGSRIFFRRGCSRLLLYFNTNKPHSFFFCRLPVVLENRRSSRGGGGGGAHPVHPPPRSAPGMCSVMFCSFKTCLNLFDFALSSLMKSIGRI